MTLDTACPLFAYGTLRDPDVLRRVLGWLPAADTLLPARAPGCAAVYMPQRTYPALCRRSGAAAPGLLVTGLSPRDMAALDRFEGHEYLRRAVALRVGDADLQAQAYWPVSPVPPGAPIWLLEDWARRHKAAFLADNNMDSTQSRAAPAAPTEETSNAAKT